MKSLIALFIVFSAFTFFVSGEVSSEEINAALDSEENLDWLVYGGAILEVVQGEHYRGGSALSVKTPDGEFGSLTGQHLYDRTVQLTVRSSHWIQGAFDIWGGVFLMDGQYVERNALPEKEMLAYQAVEARLNGGVVDGTLDIRHLSSTGQRTTFSERELILDDLRVLPGVALQVVGDQGDCRLEVKPDKEFYTRGELIEITLKDGAKDVALDFGPFADHLVVTNSSDTYVSAEGRVGARPFTVRTGRKYRLGDATFVVPNHYSSTGGFNDEGNFENRYVLGRDFYLKTNGVAGLMRLNARSSSSNGGLGGQDLDTQNWKEVDIYIDGYELYKDLDAWRGIEIQSAEFLPLARLGPIVEPVRGGSVSGGVSNGVYDSSETTRRFVASPDEGWRFERWQGDVVSESSELQLSSDYNLRIHPVFYKPVGLSDLRDYSGSFVWREEALEDGTMSLYADEASASPSGLHTFGWSLEGPGTFSIKDVRATQYDLRIKIDGEDVYPELSAGKRPVDLQVGPGLHYVVFEATPDGAQVEPELEMRGIEWDAGVLFHCEIAGRGTVEGLDPGTNFLEPGTHLDVRAVPDAGYRFKRWRGAFEGTEPEASVFVSAGARLYADFVREPSLEEPHKPSVFGGAALAEDGNSFSVGAGLESGETAGYHRQVLGPCRIYYDTNPRNSIAGLQVDLLLDGLPVDQWRNNYKDFPEGVYDLEMVVTRTDPDTPLIDSASFKTATVLYEVILDSLDADVTLSVDPTYLEEGVADLPFFSRQSLFYSEGESIDIDVGGAYSLDEKGDSIEYVFDSKGIVVDRLHHFRFHLPSRYVDGWTPVRLGLSNWQEHWGPRALLLDLRLDYIELERTNSHTQTYVISSRNVARVEMYSNGILIDPLLELSEETHFRVGSGESELRLRLYPGSMNGLTEYDRPRLFRISESGDVDQFFRSPSFLGNMHIDSNFHNRLRPDSEIEFEFEPFSTNEFVSWFPSSLGSSKKLSLSPDSFPQSYVVPLARAPRNLNGLLFDYEGDPPIIVPESNASRIGQAYAQLPDYEYGNGFWRFYRSRVFGDRPMHGVIKHTATKPIRLLKNTGWLERIEIGESTTVTLYVDGEKRSIGGPLYVFASPDDPVELRWEVHNSGKGGDYVFAQIPVPVKAGWDKGLVKSTQKDIIEYSGDAEDSAVSHPSQFNFYGGSNITFSLKPGSLQGRRHLGWVVTQEVGRGERQFIRQEGPISLRIGADVSLEPVFAEVIGDEVDVSVFSREPFVQYGGENELGIYPSGDGVSIKNRATGADEWRHVAFTTSSGRILRPDGTLIKEITTTARVQIALKPGEEIVVSNVSNGISMGRFEFGKGWKPSLVLPAFRTGTYRRFEQPYSIEHTIGAEHILVYSSSGNDEEAREKDSIDLGGWYSFSTGEISYDPILQVANYDQSFYQAISKSFFTYNDRLAGQEVRGREFWFSNTNPKVADGENTYAHTVADSGESARFNRCTFPLEGKRLIRLSPPFEYDLYIDGEKYAFDIESDPIPQPSEARGVLFLEVPFGSKQLECRLTTGSTELTVGQIEPVSGYPERDGSFEGGSIKMEEGYQVELLPSDVVRITATPSSGYRFAGWKEPFGDMSGFSSVSIRADLAQSLVPIFEKAPTVIVRNGVSWHLPVNQAADRLRLELGRVFSRGAVARFREAGVLEIPSLEDFKLNGEPASLLHHAVALSNGRFLVAINPGDSIEVKAFFTVVDWFSSSFDSTSRLVVVQELGFQGAFGGEFRKAALGDTFEYGFKFGFSAEDVFLGDFQDQLDSGGQKLSWEVRSHRFGVVGYFYDRQIGADAFRVASSGGVDVQNEKVHFSFDREEGPKLTVVEFPRDRPGDYELLFESTRSPVLVDRYVDGRHDRRINSDKFSFSSRLFDRVKEGQKIAYVIRTEQVTEHGQSKILSVGLAKKGLNDSYSVWLTENGLPIAGGTFFEQRYRLLDFDGDGFTNAQEFVLGQSPVEKDCLYSVHFDSGNSMPLFSFPFFPADSSLKLDLEFMSPESGSRWTSQISDWFSEETVTGERGETRVLLRPKFGDMPYMLRIGNFDE